MRKIFTLTLVALLCACSRAPQQARDSDFVVTLREDQMARCVCEGSGCPTPTPSTGPLDTPDVWLPQVGDTFNGQRVIVGWDDVPGATSYNVGLRESDGWGRVYTAPFTSGQSPSDAWGFVITDIDPAPAEYGVAVRARNELNVSAWSDVISITVQ